MATVKLTQSQIDWLYENRILFDWLGNKTQAVGTIINFDDNLMLEPYCSFRRGPNLCDMGAFSYTQSNIEPDQVIGRYCSLAWGITFVLGQHPYNYMSTSQFTWGPNQEVAKIPMLDEGLSEWTYTPFHHRKKPCIIGHDVWVGANCLIKEGVTIGTGSVIAAHSVVTKSVPPYAIVGGNPAKFIKRRFSDEICEQMLDSEWWKYKFTDFKNAQLNTPEGFLEFFNEKKNTLKEYNPVKIKLIDILSDLSWDFQTKRF